MDNRERLRNVEQVMLAHLDDAYNLARWLVRDPRVAADAVVEACDHASRSFAAYRGGPVRAWLLGFVHEACYARLGHDARGDDDPQDRRKPDAEDAAGVIHRRDPAAIDGALSELPATWRECIVLRDLQGLSYADMACIIDVPVGTVMTRLMRARQALRGGPAPGAMAEATSGNRDCRSTGTVC